MRDVADAAERVADGVHRADHAVAERRAGHARRHGHVGAHVRGVAADGDGQLFDDDPHGGEGEGVAQRVVLVAGAGLDGVAERVQPGGCGHARRQRLRHARIEERRVGHHVGGDVLQLDAPVRMADDGHGRALAAGSGGGRHGDERHALAARQVFAAHQAEDVVRPLADQQVDALGRVQHRAAAERHDAVAALIAVELRNRSTVSTLESAGTRS